MSIKKKIFNYVFYGVVGAIILFYGYTKFFLVSIGNEAPDFKIKLVNGTPFQLSDLQGNYVLLDFWASWCPPCRQQNLSLVALHNKYKGKLKVVTVALERNDKAWKKASLQDGFNWEYQIVDQSKIVLLSEIARKYGVTEIPTKFLISPKGKLLGKLSFNEIEFILNNETKK